MGKIVSPLKINARSDPERGICHPVYDADGNEIAVWSEAQVRAVIAEARQALRFVKDFRAMQPIVERAIQGAQSK